MKQIITFYFILILFFITSVDFHAQPIQYFSKIDKSELSQKEIKEKLQLIKTTFTLGKYKVNKNYIIKKHLLQKLMIGYWNISFGALVAFKKNGVLKVYNKFYDHGNSPEYSGYYKFEDNAILLKAFNSKKKEWQRCPIKEVILKKHRNKTYSFTFLFQKPFLFGYIGMSVSFK